MSIGQTFPDIIDLGGGRFRLITEGAFSYVHHNTTIGDLIHDNPREILISGEGVVDAMREDGLIVRQNQR
tara:strand:- start:431 stop:640 length:210 start_codon:yes stop_codon:yes gene_type:complete